MAETAMFKSSVRTDGGQAGVFEYDGDTGYFYLYNIKNEEGGKITDAIHLLTGKPDFTEKDIAVHWDPSSK